MEQIHEVQYMETETAEYGDSYLQRLVGIFYTFFKIGLFTFGGGFAMIPLIERELVNQRGWIEKDKFIDAISITQSVPGAVAINLSIFFGYNIAGILGAIVATIGVALPSIVIILFIGLFFDAFIANPIINRVFIGIRPAIVALILHAGINLSKGISWSKPVLITAISVFVATSFLGISPIIVVASIIAFGILVTNRQKANRDKNTHTKSL